MKHKLDIFRKLPDGQFLWVKAVEGLEEARFQLRLLMQGSSDDYFIYDAHSGCKIDLPAHS